MSKEFHKLALDYHQGKKPGKIFVSSHKSLETHEDLSLAYTPGVAAPVREIERMNLRFMTIRLRVIW